MALRMRLQVHATVPDYRPFASYGAGDRAQVLMQLGEHPITELYCFIYVSVCVCIKQFFLNLRCALSHLS